jgi:hypothetical protein
MANSMMFDGQGDEMVLLGPLTAFKGNASQGQIVALRATTRKDYLIGTTVEDVCYGSPRCIHSVLRFAT